MNIMGDLFNDLRMKIWPLSVMTIISIIAVIAIAYCVKSNYTILCKLISTLSTVNITMLGVDIAAIAILYALLQEKKMDDNAIKAFKEQNISFVGNAFLQLVAFISSIFFIFCSTDVMAYISLFIQFLALTLIFDLIIELYSLHSAITNKQ